MLSLLSLVARDGEVDAEVLSSSPWGLMTESIGMVQRCSRGAF